MPKSKKSMPFADDPSPEPSEYDPLPEWETEIRRAYFRLVDAKIERAERGHDLVGELTYESEAPVWLAISDALGACLDAPKGQGVLPNEMVVDIKLAIDTILTRKFPETFKKLVKKGNRNGPPLIEDKRAAVLYFRACEDGLIDDPQPIEKLAGWFGMTEIRWLKDWPKKFTDVRTEAFRPDDHDDIRAGLIETLARKSGEHWQEFGRSAPKKKNKDKKNNAVRG